MDLGQPLDLMSMILPALQPGPPPPAAAGFEDTLAAMLSGESVPEAPAGPPPSFGPMAEALKGEALIPGPPLPAPSLRTEPEPAPELRPFDQKEAPDLEPALAAGALVHQALVLPPSALFSKLAPSPQDPAADLGSPGTPASLPALPASAPSQQPFLPPTVAFEAHTPAATAATAAAATPEAPEPPQTPTTSPEGPPSEPAQAAPRGPSPGLGARILHQQAGRQEHPLMQLEKAAAARWNQLTQQSAPPEPSPASTPELSWAPVLTQAAPGPKSKKPPSLRLDTPSGPQPTVFSAESPSQPELPEAPTQTSAALPVPQSAETPEEWVPTPRVLELEIDPELSLSLSAQGRALDLSLSGSAEALAPLGELEAELRENLERGGWQLRDFDTQERGQGQPPPRKRGPHGARPQARSEQAPARRAPLPRGAHINRVA